MNCSTFAISIRSLRQFCCDFYGWARETHGKTNRGFPPFCRVTPRIKKATSELGVAALFIWLFQEII